MENMGRMREVSEDMEVNAKETDYSQKVLSHPTLSHRGKVMLSKRQE